MTHNINNKQSVSGLLYSTILYLLVPFIVIRLLLISISKSAYRDRIQERFGFANIEHTDLPVIWIHAVSVGEVFASGPLVNEFIRCYPHYRIMITTMTPTGAETVSKQFGDRVMHRYIPYDLPGAVKRFILTVRPVLLVVMETEIWPNLFDCCKRHNIPVVIANARMSEKSCNGYKRLSGLTRFTLSNVSCVIAQGQMDADRFIALGLDKNKVKISGSIKFDIDMPEKIRQHGKILRKELFMDRPVWIAASTHTGEEQYVLSAFSSVLNLHPDCLLVIAPRHPERGGVVAELSVKSGFVTARKSLNEPVSKETEVYILDTLGELPEYYAASDLAFVGGSLVPHGGHNMLEPASLGIPVVTGPFTHNFSDISLMLQQADAAWIVTNAEQLMSQVNILLADNELRNRAGQKGKDIVEANRGSVHRVMEILHSYLAT